MFETLELQQLNTLTESKVRDFASPKSFHCIKVQRLSGNKVKASAEIMNQFPMPIFALIGNLLVKTSEFSYRTPPIVRTFDLSAHGFAKVLELCQGLFQELRMYDLLTSVQGQVGIHAEVCTYTFTCSGQHFFGDVICDDIQIVFTASIPKELDITHIPMPIAMAVIEDIATLEDELLFRWVPFFERQADIPLFKCVSRLELRRTVSLLFLELRGGLHVSHAYRFQAK